MYENTHKPQKFRRNGLNNTCGEQLAVHAVYKHKCGLWQKIVCKLPVLDECYVKYFKHKCKS